MKKIFSILALVLVALSASATDPAFTVKVGTTPNGTFAFKVNDVDVTLTNGAFAADVDDVITLIVTPNTGWVVNKPTGEWSAVIAASRGQRRSQDMGMERDITLTPDAGNATSEIKTYTFTMIAANAEISCSYKKLLQDDWIQAISDLTYNGVNQSPTVTVKDGSTTLAKDVDYTVSYSNNKKAAQSTATSNAPTVTITAVTTSEKYAGTASKTFTIKKKALTVTADNKQVTYGDPIPTYTVTYDGFVNNETASVLGGTLGFTCSYAQNTSGVDTYDITPKDLTSNNYAITFTNGTLTVVAKALAADMIGTIDAVTYTGNALTPEPVLTFNGMTLVKGTDYSVSYENNVNVGTAAIVTVTGTGNYSGTVSKNFTINPVDADDSDELGVTLGFYNVTYNGRAQTPGVTLMFGDTELVEGTDYDVEYSNNTAVGTATVTVTLKGNFTGTIEEDFVIDPIEGNVSFTDKNVFRIYDPDNNTYSQKAVVEGNGQVTYTSSNKQVATVNAKTGVVQIVGAGTTVITATVSNSSTFDYEGANQASYTLRIDKATPKVESEGFSGDYDGEGHGITVIAPEGCIIKYGTKEGEYTLSVAPTYVEQGSYTVYFCVYGDNYKLVKGSATVVINNGTTPDPGPGPEPQVLRGDINADGVVDADDLALFIAALAYDRLPSDPNSEEFYRYDANGNGAINIADAQAIFNMVLGRPAVSD